MSVRLSRLALLLAIAIALIGIGGIVATWRIADLEFRDILEDDLQQQAELLAELLTEVPAQVSDAELERLLADAFEADEEETLWVSVYDIANGRLLSNLDHDQPLESQDDGLVRRSYGGYGWHGVQETGQGIVVQLMRRDDAYKEVQEEIVENIVTPALIGSGITLLLLTVLITLTLGPLARLVRELDARNADSLVPLATRTSAREIGVLRDSINGLMRGIEVVVTRERQFVSDVAHELRTPLTTLKLELGTNEPDMTALRIEVDRLTRLIEQLLTLARLEQSHWQQRFDSFSLTDSYTNVIDRVRARFRHAGMTLEADLAPVCVCGDATLLEVLLQNLLRNVLEHCPAGTKASVSLDKEAAAVVLRVADDGPGMAGGTLHQISRGFTSLDAKSEGLGLGLAICHRIVAIHRGTIRFSARAHGADGLLVEVRIPA